MPAAISPLDGYLSATCMLACSRRSDSRAQEKNSRRKKKRFPGVQLNLLPTYRRALPSEHLEQATCMHEV